LVSKFTIPVNVDMFAKPPAVSRNRVQHHNKCLKSDFENTKKGCTISADFKDLLPLIIMSFKASQSRACEFDAPDYL
jgi:hypothetical protein